jgi:hypothetical protein
MPDHPNKPGGDAPGAPEPDTAVSKEPQPQVRAVASPSRPTLAQRMALPEPARTKALEEAASKGEQFYLRAKGRDVKICYGDLILTVTKNPKGFSAAHAIHILWKRPGLVDEVEP